MRYLKKYNKNKVSIFNSDWIKFLPTELTIKTENGEFTLKRKNELVDSLGHPVDISNIMNCIQISYYQSTIENGEDVLDDGEPDYLCFDITLVKDNKGGHANPDSLRLNIDISYGDNMQYEFTIDKPNIVKVYHYTGKNSLYDSETFWGFTKDSLKTLVDFFNRFGFETTVDDFKFIDDVPDSFQYEKPSEKGDKIEPMMMKGDGMKDKVDSLKGGDRIKKYGDFNEDIKVPIKVGDTVLGGRFKNKKMVVKKIGKNAKGDITINDKPLLKFRIIKESFFEQFKDDVEINLTHLIDEGFTVNVDQMSDSDYIIRIWLPINRTDSEYSYENSKDFNWSDVEDEIIRAIDYISEHNEINYLYTIASKGQDGFGFKRAQWNVSQLMGGTMNPGTIKSLLINVTEHPQL